MQLRVHLWGGGVAVPKTKIGATVAMGAGLTIRAAPGHSENTFLIYDFVELGGKNGTLGASTIETKWMNIDPAAYPWTVNCDTFKDGNFEVTLHGTVVGEGYVDVTIDHINSENDKTTLLKKYNVESNGFQMTETKIYGQMKMQKGKTCSLQEIKQSA